MPIRTAVIGAGRLGSFHAEKHAQLASCELIAVVDPVLETAQALAKRLGVSAVTQLDTIIDSIDAATIAAPTQFHYEIAKTLLQAGKHILVEKPITVSVAQADELVALAAQQDCVLQVGHVERFSPALLALEKYLSNPTFIEAHRIAPYTARGTDVDVILDLMIHDIDIILHLVGSDIRDIHASGISVLTEGVDIANVRLVFNSGCVANVTASRVSLKRERRMRFFQRERCLAVDFQAQALIDYFKSPSGDQIEQNVQNFSNTDAILAETESFFTSIKRGGVPKVSGQDGRRALATAIQIINQVNQQPVSTHS